MTKRGFGGVTTEVIRQKLRRKIIQDTLTGIGIGLKSSCFPLSLRFLSCSSYTERAETDADASSNEMEVDSDQPNNQQFAFVTNPISQESSKGWFLDLIDGSKLLLHTYNYRVKVEHVSGKPWLSMKFTADPPSLSEILNAFNNKPSFISTNIDFHHEGLLAQISSLESETWEVIIPASLPLMANLYTAFMYVELRFSTSFFSRIRIPPYPDSRALFAYFFTMVCLLQVREIVCGADPGRR